MAILLQDSFNRANNAASLGTPDVGGPYTVRSGTWGISSNRALGPVTAAQQVTFPAAVNVDFQYMMPVGASSSNRPWIMWRWVDVSNYWAFDPRSGSGSVSLYMYVGGTINTMMTVTGSQAVGDVYRVRAHGEDVALYLNGALLGRCKDPRAHIAGSAAGLQSFGGSANQWDDLLVQDADPIDPPWGAGAVDMEMPSLAYLDADADYALTPSLYKGRDTALADESEIP